MCWRCCVAAGYLPTGIEYLGTGRTRAQLLGLLAAAAVNARQALRVAKSPADAMGLTDPAVTDEALIAAMVAHPVLVNRPFVCTARGVRLCRPSELVLDRLDRMPPGPFAQEDGQVNVDAQRNRVL